MKSKIIAASVAAVSVAALSASPALAAPAAAPSAKKIEVGVAPSPNGYVMAGVPTQVAVNQNATVYHRAGGKWMMLGKGTASKAIPITFDKSGVYSLKVKAGKQSKIVKVGVYADQPLFSSRDSKVMGGLVFSSNGSFDREGEVSIPASSGCVSVTVGISPHNRPGDEGWRSPGAITVNSTGAPAWASGPVTATEGFAALNIPIKGDSVVGYTGAGKYFSYIYVGGSALCLAPVR